MSTHLLQQVCVIDIEDQIVSGAPSLTNAHKRELDRRLADHLENPDDVDSWSEVKAAALAKIGQWA